MTTSTTTRARSNAAPASSRPIVTLKGKGKVVIQAVAGDWRSALDNALGRAARTLLRLRQRSRQPGRAGRTTPRRPPALPQG